MTRERKRKRDERKAGFTITTRETMKDADGVTERTARQFFSQVPCPVGCEVWLAGRTIVGSHTLTVIRTERVESAPDPNVLMTTVDFVETHDPLTPIPGGQPTLMARGEAAINYGVLYFVRYGPALQCVGGISEQNPELKGTVEGVRQQSTALAKIAILALVPGNVLN
jgi:hypothetical protein